jgi:hypothetical protein
LIELAASELKAALAMQSQRPLLEFALKRDAAKLSSALELEEKEEREKDRDYWVPLKRELEALRRRKL